MDYKRGQHPASQANLKLGGAKSQYDEKKKHHRVTVTDTGWNQAQEILKKNGLSISKMIELVGRKEITLNFSNSSQKQNLT